MTRTSDPFVRQNAPAGSRLASGHREPSAELYRCVIDSIADYAVIALDPGGNVLSWNPGAERLEGYDAGEIVGRHVSTLYLPDDVTAGRPGQDLDAAARHGCFRGEAWRVRKDGSRFRAGVVISAMRNERGELAGFAEVTRELASGEGEIGEAVRLRDDVLAIVAHDLRNPMHVIMGAASLLALEPADASHQRHVAIIQRSTREMERLISDLLDVARIESGAFAIRRDRLDVGALLEETVDSFQAQAAARQIALRCELPEGVRPIIGDRDRLARVLSNLVVNALRFSPPGRRVSVRAWSAPDGVQVSVKDSGDGIPADDLSHLFDRFWQANRASRAGAGLGLSICKGIVEAHAGRIWAASRVGRGTTFHFTLPYAQD